MVVQDNQMTVEKFWEQYADKPYELVEGVVVPTYFLGALGGVAGANVIGYLGAYVDQHKMGEVYAGRVGVKLSANTLLGPDVAFIRNERLKGFKNQDSYLPVSPDLAVEILPPEKTEAELERRSVLYLKGGTRRVWMLYPSSRTIVVHHLDGRSEAVGLDGTLDGEDVLPGLRIPVAKLFPPEQE